MPSNTADMPSPDGEKLERGEMNGNGTDSYDHIPVHEQLRNVLSQTQSISPDLFEKMYLNPKMPVAGQLRRTFANPTPLALMGFSVGLTPLSCEFMGWRGSGNFATATTTASIWYGGMLLIIAGGLEWILGNTFSFIVFMGYGAHFLTQATTFMPFYDAIAFNSKTGSAAANGPQDITPTFTAGFAFYALSLSLLSFVFLLGSLRTNICFVMIFVCATIGFGMAAGAFWQITSGNMALGGQLTVGVGACFFAASMLGWYLLISVMIATMELPIPDLPVFDLSTIIKAKSRSKAE